MGKKLSGKRPEDQPMFTNPVDLDFEKRRIFATTIYSAVPSPPTKIGPEFARMKNSSGGALAAGDVVVLKSAAAGDEITTTTTVGDEKVFGVVAETIADAAYGIVQVWGKNVNVKVNGTDDIAIGDFLSTYSVAKIGRKAASGDMVFAMALEAYTTDDSSGVIDALIIKPRSIGIGTHNILDGSVHLDSVANTVTRGSIIYGNATPKWDELTVGAADTTLVSDGTDISWSAARTKISTANKTIYIDKGASGANDGTSWTDAFESWADCKAYLTGYVIAHDWTIKVRYNATPYRETFDFDGFTVWGTLTVEAEYYWYGACEANVGGAGEITDTGAFADVLVGDKVFVLDLNGANSRAQDYEVCTVDSIANIPNRIGTDGAKTSTTNWDYVVVRTEISGSDDGTDGGTARAYCFVGTSIDNVKLKGFHITFSDANCIYATNSRGWRCDAYICEGCDAGPFVEAHSVLNLSYGFVETTASVAGGAGTASYYDTRHTAIKAPASGAGYALYAYRLAMVVADYIYIPTGVMGACSLDSSWLYLVRCTIAIAVTTGMYARHNSVVRHVLVSNNAGTPENPSGTSEGAYIG